MSEFSTIIIITLLGIFSFINPSGWAQALQLPQMENYAIVALSLIFYFFRPNSRLRIPTPEIILLLFTFIMIPMYMKNNLDGASYLASFLVIYIISQGTITWRVIRLSGMILAAMGLVILNIYINGTLLSGWNDNAIAMAGLFSFLYFSIYLISKRNTKSFWLWNIVTFIYLDMLFECDCRSGMLFSIIAVLAIFFIGHSRSIISRKQYNLLLLNIPLIIALLVIWISTTPYYAELNTWSISNFDKEIFNNRETLWSLALEPLGKYWMLIGSCKFIMNYHNSCVAALSVFGILGYIAWIGFFSIILKQLKQYLSDGIVCGAIISFSIIYLQQTTDLGFIGPEPNFIPYLILGVGLGRIQTIRKEEYIRSTGFPI